MATINQLVTSGKLVLYEADLEANEQRERLIYLAPELVLWFGDYLDFQSLDRRRDLSPYEQVAEMFDQFVRGYHMGRGDMKKLSPLRQHVWEFKPTDVRILGYFYKRDIFIAVCGEMKHVIKGNYKPFIERVVSFRSALNLNPPCCLEGESLDDVVSI